MITNHLGPFGLNVLGAAAALLDGDWPATAYRLSVANGDVAYFAKHATIAPRRDGMLRRV